MCRWRFDPEIGVDSSACSASRSCQLEVPEVGDQGVRKALVGDPDDRNRQAALGLVDGEVDHFLGREHSHP